MSIRPTLIYASQVRLGMKKVAKKFNGQYVLMPDM